MLLCLLGDYKKQYPDAKVIAVQEAAKKVKSGLKFDGGTCFVSQSLCDIPITIRAAWGADPSDTKYGFEDDVSGHILANMCI